jgi:hypothetical protein
MRSYRAPVQVCNRLEPGSPVLILALLAREPGGQIVGQNRASGGLRLLVAADGSQCQPCSAPLRR